ncbi:TnsD family transposase [Paenibacillus hamazuiensis]|uniref:TnsD family transposase n=1 Tax=Paenibacillus hamazuiensis TaxID=2936508 RepID=UPI00200C6983|nr:TnsD family transposase [Paenibacillus hamazuiensis]
MVPFFPTLHEDELLYSGIARFHIQMGNISPKSTIKELFGSTSICSSIELPSGIDQLVSNLPIGSKLTASEIIDKHTLYPFYSAFLPPLQAGKVKSLMKSLNGKGIFACSGLMASSIKANECLRYCPICGLSDQKNYGTMYWHRLHQIPGVTICEKHGCYLLDSIVPVQQVNKHVFTASNIDLCPVESVRMATSNEGNGQYRLLLNSIYSLTQNKYPHRPLEWFQQRYLNRLIQLEYATLKGRIDQNKLRRDFTDFYGLKILERFQSIVQGDSNWLTEIVRKNRKSFHPLRHLLLIHFLGLTLDEIFYGKNESDTFGSPPWECHNPAAEHYGQRVIEQIEFNKRETTKRRTAFFHCSCGFIYSRSLDNDDEKIRVKEYGDIWKKELKRLLEQGTSFREIARRLHADVNTIIKHAKQTEQHIYNEEKVQDQQKELYRSKWIMLQESHPEKSKTELRRMDKRLYSWLYRNDEAWLTANSPGKKASPPTNQRIDWEARDDEILRLVESAVSEILNLNTKPPKITIGRIGLMIGRKALLEKHLDKLPKTSAWLQNVLESDEQFRLRKINWAIKELEQEGQELSVWRVLRKATIRIEHCPPDIEELIRIQDYTSTTLSY